MKRTFLLLEVLLALSLVTLCIAPLVSRPIKMLRLESNRLKALEKERLADWTFTEIKEKLIRNEIEWKDIPERGMQTENFPLPPAQIYLPNSPPLTIQRAFYLTGRGQREGGGKQFRQLGVFILLDQEKYQFRTPVQK